MKDNFTLVTKDGEKFKQYKIGTHTVYNNSCQSDHAIGTLIKFFETVYRPLEKHEFFFRNNKYEYYAPLGMANEKILNVNYDGDNFQGERYKELGKYWIPNFPKVLWHEMTHVVQIQTGKLFLDHKRYAIRWEGITFNMRRKIFLNEYVNLPWEAEANSVSTDIYKMWSRKKKNKG